MKFSVLFIIYIIVWGSSCPNKCSGHGSCSNGGNCLCFTGWREGDCSKRTCPSAETYVDPTATDMETSRVYLECSGKGNCNRDNGLCECFPGYEGAACQRLMCQNQCSGHGECINMNHLSMNENTMTRSFYQNEIKPVGYNNWDKLQSFACVCDEEYEGYDCSQRKCPGGYVQTNECDISNEAIQTITITPAVDNPSANPNKASGCLVYAEYTDSYNRTYYTDAFCASIAYQEASQYMGWYEALNRLPPGTIDIKEVTVKYDDNNGVTSDIDINERYNPIKTFKVTITFSKQHTGRQHSIKVITFKDLSDKDKYLGVNDESGFHGLKIKELEKSPLNLEANSNIVYSNEGITPIICSGNGLCNHETGLCECFSRYYGTACTEYDSLV